MSRSRTMKASRRIMKAITAIGITTVTGPGIIRLLRQEMNRRTITNRQIRTITPETRIITAIVITTAGMTMQRMITGTRAESKK
jgi:hypothetical protein